MNFSIFIAWKSKANVELISFDDKNMNSNNETVSFESENVTVNQKNPTPVSTESNDNFVGIMGLSEQNPIETVKNFHETKTNEIVPVSNLGRKRSIEKKSKNDIKTEDNSIDGSVLKRSRRAAPKPKVERQNLPKSNRISKPRKVKTATVTNSNAVDVLAEVDKSNETTQQANNDSFQIITEDYVNERSIHELNQDWATKITDEPIDLMANRTDFSNQNEPNRMAQDSDNRSQIVSYDEIHDKQNDYLISNVNIKHEIENEIQDSASFMMDKESKQKPSVGSTPYYRRKQQIKVKEEHYHIDKILEDWDDGEDQEKLCEKDSNELATNEDVDDNFSIISITSDTSEGSSIPYNG